MGSTGIFRMDDGSMRGRISGSLDPLLTIYWQLCLLISPHDVCRYELRSVEGRLSWMRNVAKVFGLDS